MYKTDGHVWNSIVIRATCRPIDGRLASLVNTRKGEQGGVISREKSRSIATRQSDGGGGDKEKPKEIRVWGTTV